MGKFKMPNEEQLLSKKRIYDEKKEPVWDFLEHEMRENVDKKPYNEKVGSWLKYLKELRYYKFKEGRRKTKRLHKEAGPPWFYELSSKQREILRDLKTDIHQDLLEDLPTRVRRALGDLGITLKLEDEMLMQAMQMSTEDAGLFFWNLYSYYYNKNPSDLRENYDMNARIMLSALVFVDLDDCIAQLEELLKQPSTSKIKPKKKTKKYFEPKVKYGEYLQKMYVPFFTTHPDEEEAEKKKNLAKPLPPDYKIKLRSAESKERLRKDTTFLKKRKERNTEEKDKSDRECHYKFWEPPSTLRNTDPKMAAYVMKLKMFKEKARPKFMKYKAPFENLQLHIGTVAYTGGHPNFILNNAVTLPTGYIPINGGAVRYGTEYITNILGYWKFPRDTDDKCDPSCDCAAKWEGKVIDYIKSSKCKCGHRYDLYNEGKPTEKYFYKSKREGAFWIDHAKIYQMDPTEDFIKDTVKEAVRSLNVSGTTLNPTIAASGLKPEQLLDAFLGDLHETPLLIPHLPKANLLNNLKEWTRKRVQGPLTKPNHRKLLLQSQRRWLDLKHMDYRARACRIPFTQKQLRNMDWSHRDMIQKLFNNLLNDFTTRSRRKQVEQTRMWWSTMKNDAYPNKAFAEIFFTYMPGRMKDSFLLNPYSANLIPKGGGKTCPLR